MKQLGVCLALVLTVGATSSCGGGGGGSGSAVDTGLSDTRLLSSVTPEEATQACESIESAFSARLDVQSALAAVCELVGAALSDTEAQCRQVADDCVAQAQRGEGMLKEEDFEQDFDCDEEESQQELASCEATVGEFEQCMNDQLALAEQTLAAFSCANAPNTTPEALSEAQAGPPLPASCEALEEKCPDAAGDAF